jgi:outer membrane protein OmpA-like peptidoglycan-associated protein
MCKAFFMVVIGIMGWMLPLVIMAQTALPLQFEEKDFERNVNRWYQLENEKGEITYHNALYVDPDKDFLLEAEFDCAEAANNAVFGLSWGRQNKYDYRHFEVSKQRKFRLGYKRGKNYNVVQPWTARRGIIELEKNTLAVQKKGMELRLIVNGKTIYKTTYRRFDYSGVALKSSSSKVRFVRFAIYQERGPINLPPGLDKSLAGVPQNLGTGINSPLVEKAPSISPDGQSLYLVREQAPDGYGQQDIYYSEQLGDGQWDTVKNIGRPLNNSNNNFVISVLPDNNTLMVINAYKRTTKRQILSLAQRTATGWRLQKIVEIEEIGNIGRWVSFDLSADGRTLVFAMYRPDSYGGRDLYVSFLQPSGLFSKPRNLGPTINTTGNEHSPFLAADGKTLYFDTDGHPGYGGRDIFKTTRLDESWTNWGVPQNLGPIINNEGANEGLSIPASGEYAYFVSEGADGQGAYDIYRLGLPPVSRPLPVALMTGFVVDCTTMKGVATKVEVYKNEQFLAVSSAQTHPVTGQFKVVLPQGARYTIITTYDKDKYTAERDTITVDLTHFQAYTEQELDPICLYPKQQATPTPTPPPTPQPVIPIRAQYIPQPVYFEFDAYVLTDSAKLQLKALADTLLLYPEAQLALAGHTDAVGSLVYNKTLAKRRVQAVREFLQQAGIATSRLQSQDWGELRPIADNGLPQGRAANRRVELWLE